jgi:hypothetical protein
MEARKCVASAQIAAAPEAAGAAEATGAAEVCDVAWAVGVPGVGDDEAAQAATASVRKSTGARRRKSLDIGVPLDRRGLDERASVRDRTFVSDR